MYGVDVTKVRADDLDKKILAAVRAAPGVLVLELGCGSGVQSVRLAQAGARVVAVDIDKCGPLVQGDQVRFLRGDVRNINMLIPKGQFDICLFQRTIHYLRYEEARVVLTHLKTMVKDRLYISVSGLESDIGRAYSDAAKPVYARFTKLSEPDAETFSIHEPLCLYTPEEFMVLLQESGWEIEELWVSAFGNIKAVCT